MKHYKGPGEHSVEGLEIIIADWKEEFIKLRSAYESAIRDKVTAQFDALQAIKERDHWKSEHDRHMFGDCKQDAAERAKAQKLVEALGTIANMPCSYDHTAMTLYLDRVEAIARKALAEYSATTPIESSDCPKCGLRKFNETRRTPDYCQCTPTKSIHEDYIVPEDGETWTPTESSEPTDDEIKAIFYRYIDENKIQPGEYLAFKIGVKWRDSRQKRGDKT